MGKHDDGLAGHDNGTEAGGACGGMRFAFPPYGGIGRVLPVGPAGHESGGIAAVEGEIADQFSIMSRQTARSFATDPLIPPERAAPPAGAGSGSRRRDRPPRRHATP